MASPKDKIEADAMRAKTRGVGGYLADRALGRADFSKAPAPAVSPAPAAPVVAPMGDESVLKRREREAGLKKGGGVKKFARGGSVGRDGIAQRGKTRGRNV